jgi:hypothetical protein
LREYLRREGVSAEELLPIPLKLRKEVERQTETVQDLGSEQEVREVVAGLNRRIMQWRRIPVGPPVFLPPVDEETMVSRWRDGQSVIPSISSPAPADRKTTDRETTERKTTDRKTTDRKTTDRKTTGTESPRRRWWHRSLS